MNTAKQAMENMEYVRRLLDGSPGAAGLPFVARTPHPPLIPACD
jgi:hypothetical protein